MDEFEIAKITKQSLAIWEKLYRIGREKNDYV